MSSEGNAAEDMDVIETVTKFSQLSFFTFRFSPGNIRRDHRIYSRPVQVQQINEVMPR